jgi:hypothetical protein
MNKIEKGMPKKKYWNLQKQKTLTIKKNNVEMKIVAPKDKEHWFIFLMSRETEQCQKKKKCWKKKCEKNVQPSLKFINK